MNIFVVNTDPYTAAYDLCDKHIVKMIVESTQMLSIAHRVLDGTPSTRTTKSGRTVKHWTHPKWENELCLPAMVHHPCTKWAMQTLSNYNWLWQHTDGMLEQYTFRYDKIHSMTDLVRTRLIYAPTNINIGDLTPFAQAMPVQYQSNDAVVSYRNYYIGEKKKFATWRKTLQPSWFAVGEHQ